MNDIYQDYENKTGKTVEVTYRSIPELQERLKANPYPQDRASFWHLLWAQGMGSVGRPEQLSNGVCLEWNPKGIMDVVAP